MLKQIYQTAKAQHRNQIKRFMRDMKRAGIKMRGYHGRWFWHGPAVVTNDEVSLQDVLGATKVPCQWDSMGLDYVVYPVESLRKSVAN